MSLRISFFTVLNCRIFGVLVTTAPRKDGQNGVISDGGCEPSLATASLMRLLTAL